MNKKSKVSLIVCDMDGTLFSNNKTVSDVNKAAISMARSHGVRFSICTGRIQPMTEFYLKDLELDTPVITANGAVIWDPVKKSMLWSLPMDNSEALAILKFCREHQLDYCALTMSESYFSPDNIRRQRFEQYNQIATAHGFVPMQLREFDASFDCVKDKLIYKILIYSTDKEEQILSRNFLNALSLTGYTSSEPGLLDVAHEKVNKGYGLSKLAELLNIPSESVCAMGDFENDIPMLEYCGYPVAMENGCDVIKEKADFVTKTNDEHGVAWAINHYLKPHFQKDGQL